MFLPETPQQFNRMLTVRFMVGAIAAGIISGGVAWLVESRRVESAALENVSEAVRHFESSAMLAVSGNEISAGHEVMDNLLARSNLMAIRVITPTGQPIYENWGSLPDEIRQMLLVIAVPQITQGRLSAGEEELLWVVRPLISQTKPIGFLEGLYRIDRETLAAWHERVLASVLTAALSVFFAVSLLYPLMIGLLRHATRLSSLLLESNLSLLGSLGNAVAKRDSDTDAHNYRVTLYAVALAEAMGLSPKDIGHLVAGAFLHDVGKIGIPDRILLKPGKLTSGEFEIMKTHSLLGLEIVSGNAWMNQAVCVIRHHHERFDGKGYLDRLAGDAIPIMARVFAVADVFDALTSERPYKPAIPPSDALAMIEAESGSHFDPDAVTAFKRMAVSLYSKINEMNGRDLRTTMQQTLSRYFGTSSQYKKTAPEGAVDL